MNPTTTTASAILAIQTTWAQRLRKGPKLACLSRKQTK